MHLRVSNQGERKGMETYKTRSSFWMCETWSKCRAGGDELFEESKLFEKKLEEALV
jgi:hypothetical protein